ncbi:MAG: hypothetical protein EHM20_11860 [Alphaproteobacteria bacterium]|nr:MAG: hypothetical protein EHM20_11860 [Alphaproteobacteria bacterium]
MKKPCFLKSLPITLLVSFNLNAQTPIMDEFNQFFKSGQYSKAISSLEKFDEKENVLGQKYYLAGICYSKLQEFDKAIQSFQSAIKEKNTNADLYYEYGQALYAANELKAARIAFQKSADQKFNPSASIYYVAHISQIIEDYSVARSNYLSLIKSKETDQKMKQVARFQLGETLLLIMKEKVSNNEELEKGVAKFIIPTMKQAYNEDKESQVASEINTRIKELQKEFGLDPDLMKNGRRISPKRFSSYFVQRIKFDDNISLTNEENNTQQSEKESYIFETELYAKYDFVLKKRFIVSPEARINFVHHSDQDSPEVFQNDSHVIYTNLKNKYEHTVNNQPASLLFNLEYANTFKDWKQAHKRTAYAQSTSIGIGESFNYFSFGDSSFKFKRKDYSGENTSISNTTYTMSADQTALLPNQHLLIALLEMNFVNNFNNPTSNTNTYLTRFDYLIPELMPRYTLGLAFSTILTDTKAQKATRGTEVSLNPSVDLSNALSENMKISVNYDYTHNKSKQSAYSYQKSVFSTELRYSF